MPRPALLLLLALALPAAAQSKPNDPPTLNQILDRLSRDADEYAAFVPNFFCDEHVLSQELKSGKVKKEATLDSNFRVVRAKTGPTFGQLVETKEPRLLNGRPTTKAHVNLPIVIADAFTSAVKTFFSADARSCYTYKLLDNGTGPIEVDFTIRDVLIPMVAQCGAFAPGTTGKALVDRTTLHAIHVDRAHPDAPGKITNSASVDFTKIDFGSGSFYLPTTVDALVGTQYRYRATYSNCHKLAVTTTITPVPEPK